MEELRNKQKQKTRFFISPIYKFPFDVYVSQDWDVEHIDSATTNALKRDDEKRSWILSAEHDLQLEKSDTQDWDSTRLSNRIEELRTIADESQSLYEKDWVGNLTLLDKETKVIDIITRL